MNIILSPFCCLSFKVGIWLDELEDDIHTLLEPSKYRILFGVLSYIYKVENGAT